VTNLEEMQKLAQRIVETVQDVEFWFEWRDVAVSLDWVEIERRMFILRNRVGRLESAVNAQLNGDAYVFGPCPRQGGCPADDSELPL
jgi:hypothetical protein